MPQLLVSKPHCKHTGDKMLFDFDGRKFFPGGSSSDYYENHFDLVLDLGGAVSSRIRRDSEKFATAGSEATKILAEHLNDLASYEVPDFISFRWTDMDAPPSSVGVHFWNLLLARLPEGNILVCCIGGHGRTGTALAAILIVRGYTANEAIKTMRKKHCDEAIETDSQVLYLHELEVAYATFMGDGKGIDAATRALSATKKAIKAQREKERRQEEEDRKRSLSMSFFSKNEKQQEQP